MVTLAIAAMESLFLFGRIRGGFLNRIRYRYGRSYADELDDLEPAQFQ
jgi:hypothetical protein